MASFDFDPATDGDPTQSCRFVSQVQAVLDNWQSLHNPLPSGGSYLFDLTVYAGDSQLQPLIHAADLRYKLP